jgi:hypothetical protein
MTGVARHRDSILWPLVPAAAAAVAAGLYAFGANHTPDYSTALFGRTGLETLSLKSWIATGILALAFLQVLLALRIYGKVFNSIGPPKTVRTTHRIVGVSIFLLTLPVAYHCALAYGVQTHVSARVAMHSIAGCFFYGAFAAKVLIVRSSRMPGWALPLAGGTLVALVAVLWYTSAYWYFTTV